MEKRQGRAETPQAAAVNQQDYICKVGNVYISMASHIMSMILDCIDVQELLAGIQIHTFAPPPKYVQYIFNSFFG